MFVKWKLNDFLCEWQGFPLTVKTNCNVHIDLDTIYSCLYYVCLFCHNLFMTKLLGGLSGRPRRDFLVIGKTPQNLTEKKLVLIVKSFTKVRGNSKG